MSTHDYSADGLYFITICTKDRACILSEVVLNETGEACIKLLPAGAAAEFYLKGIPGMDRYVIMPNHIHMLIDKTNGKPLSYDIRSFKGLTTKRIGIKIWQDYYYDHIIRDEEDYLTKCRYIDENPIKWRFDEYHP